MSNFQGDLKMASDPVQGIADDVQGLEGKVESAAGPIESFLQKVRPQLVLVVSRSQRGPAAEWQGGDAGMVATCMRGAVWA